MEVRYGSHGAKLKSLNSGVLDPQKQAVIGNLLRRRVAASSKRCVGGVFVVPSLGEESSESREGTIAS